MQVHLTSVIHYYLTEVYFYNRNMFLNDYFTLKLLTFIHLNNAWNVYFWKNSKNMPQK